MYIAAHSRFPTHETHPQNGYESAIFSLCDIKK